MPLSHNGSTRRERLIPVQLGKPVPSLSLAQDHHTDPPLKLVFALAVPALQHCVASKCKQPGVTGVERDSLRGLCHGDPVQELACRGSAGQTMHGSGTVYRAR